MRTPEMSMRAVPTSQVGEQAVRDGILDDAAHAGNERHDTHYSVDERNQQRKPLPALAGNSLYFSTHFRSCSTSPANPYSSRHLEFDLETLHRDASVKQSVLNFCQPHELACILT